MPEVEVGVTDTGMGNLQNHLGSLRLQGRLLKGFQRLVVGDDGPGIHAVSPCQ